MANPSAGLLPHQVFVDWNEGYHAGYTGKNLKENASEHYKRAFYIGAQDRVEDEGQLNANGYDDLQDHIDVYGTEEKASDYREVL